MHFHADRYRRAVRLVVVGGGSLGMTLACVGSSWAESSGDIADQMTQQATKTTNALGVPVSTFAWGLLGLCTVVAALVVTSRSRQLVLDDLRTRSLNEKLAEFPLAERGIDRPKNPMSSAEAQIDVKRSVSVVS
jgi:hypothetical protein